ncbi:hypothetical protein VTL71DRAFT_6363 [Oculimacula yallundae]|uniref:Uncharacterized protein n=1 Tax=Oculimacula yallundae TaxID=86028 RepID=A0ABR4BXH4_9HELO
MMQVGQVVMGWKSSNNVASRILHLFQSPWIFLGEFQELSLFSFVTMLSWSPLYVKEVFWLIRSFFCPVLQTPQDILLVMFGRYSSKSTVSRPPVSRAWKLLLCQTYIRLSPYRRAWSLLRAEYRGWDARMEISCIVTIKKVMTFSSIVGAASQPEGSSRSPVEPLCIGHSRHVNIALTQSTQQDSLLVNPSPQHSALMPYRSSAAQWSINSTPSAIFNTQLVQSQPCILSRCTASFNSV